MTDPKEFMAQAKTQMDAWGAEMGKMQAKMTEAGETGQAQMAKQMDVLNVQRQKAEKHMEDLGKANMDAAKGMQESMQKAWKDMEQQMEEARKKFMG